MSNIASCVSSRERIDRSFISWSATRRSLHWRRWNIKPTSILRVHYAAA